MELYYIMGLMSREHFLECGDGHLTEEEHLEKTGDQEITPLWKSNRDLAFLHSYAICKKVLCFSQELDVLK